ncbi:carboxypeptidase regulatory-like domain-containing protein [Paenibacillus filicis]|uniref:Carboxypeptidase regulatory-like domain-containing protein n=1 Tax=Paenibacillus filicis TaxID=669464 RepID=A0ABU9DJS9_9BACL
MKVRVKVKHLVLGLLSASLLYVLFLFAVPQLQRYLDRQAVLNGTFSDKETLFHTLEAAQPGKGRWELIKSAIIERGDDSIVQRYQVYVGPDYSSSAGENEGGVPELTGDEKRPYLEEYVEHGPVDGYLVRATRQLVLYYDGKLEPERAEKALVAAEHRMAGRPTDLRWKELQLDRAKLYASAGQPERGLKLLDELTGNLKDMESYDSFVNVKIADLRVRLLGQLGQIPQALEEVERRLSSQQDTHPQLQTGNSPVQIDQLQMLKSRLEQAVVKGQQGLAVVSGTIKRSDGKPLTGAGVFLRERGTASRSVQPEDPYQTVTDAEGRFTFSGVLPDSYQLQLGLRFEQIDGWTWPVPNHEWIDVKGAEKVNRDIILQPLMKLIAPVDQQVITGDYVRFEWEPVAGAAFYNLSGKVQLSDGTIGSVLAMNIGATQADILVEKLYNHPFGVSYKMAEQGQEPKPDPIPILGFANPENRFSWSVEAFDASGRLLTRSDGYRLQEKTMGKLPFFYLQQRKLTAADRLLLDGKFEEAMRAYGQALEIDASDLHALRMLVRLYEVEASRQRQGGIPEEALPYVKRLVELSPASHYVFMLLEDSLKKRQWADADHYHAWLAEVGETGSYSDSIYAIGLLRQGKLQEASRLLRTALEQDDSHRFVGVYLAVQLYLTESLPDALALADQFPERSFGQQRPVWSALLQALHEEDQASSGYMEELKAKLAWFFADDAAQMDAWSPPAGQGAIMTFLQELRKVR